VDRRPPPAGQRWPADCDAFDRNFNVFIDDAGADGADVLPPFEVVHAITPFGGPEHLEIESHRSCQRPAGQHRLTADINAYSQPAARIPVRTTDGPSARK